MTEIQNHRIEQEHQEDLQRLQRFRPMDDDFMRGLFQQNISLAQFVLRILTGKKDLILLRCETQADMKRVTGARSICLDAYGCDADGKKYDLEIQRADRGADPHRARYHSSVLDVENLDAGQKFQELPDTYTIFITEKDFFGIGKAAYPIERINLATGKTFEDGSYILYINGEYRGEDDLGKLMHDFNCTNPNEMHFKQLAERVRYLKENPEGVGLMCRAMEEMRNQTKEATILEAIQSLMENLKLTAEQAMIALGLPEADRSRYAAKLTK